MLKSCQIRAARAILKIPQLELADLAETGLATLKKIESKDDDLEKVSFKTIRKLMEVLEEKGIEFIYPEDKNNKDGYGIVYNPSKNLEEDCQKIDSPNQ